MTRVLAIFNRRHASVDFVSLIDGKIIESASMDEFFGQTNKVNYITSKFHYEAINILYY